MKPGSSLAIIKALADQSRLAIVNSLLERPQYVEELAKRHALAPSTVSFHLRKLEQAGLVSSRKEQYYVIVEANQAAFDATLRQLVTDAPDSREVQNLRMAEYRRKVLETFFRHGRLEKLPAQHQKRLIVLEELALRFEAGRTYSEPEVTALIAPIFDDYCTIRRLLVDEGLVRREGTSYRRERGPEDPAPLPFVPMPTEKSGRTMATSNRRSDLKRMAKENAPDMGIFQIRCRANGRIFVAGSRNLPGERNSRLFQLRMGKAVFSTELQRDLEVYGAKEFEFSVLEVLGHPAPDADVEGALAALELAWLKKLQPFGERGYNNLKAYGRTLERMKLRGGPKAE